MPKLKSDKSKRLEKFNRRHDRIQRLEEENSSLRGSIEHLKTVKEVAFESTRRMQIQRDNFKRLCEESLKFLPYHLQIVEEINKSLGFHNRGEHAG